ncbi:excinuclease ABC subunit C [Candidatus Saccharibacteria bacterium RAAC3_TM7_1]|nr:excinuclease ABC subunit C [Candidatus Saccharibacteria bacterium RAAC3_TM7_1]
MNTALETKLKDLPRSPGVYFHKSRSGEIIYVGKAAVLKNRVRQYFQSTRLKDAKTVALVAEIYDTDWLETESEIDALFLESEMVKRYKPRYNVLLRDDKSQMFVRIDMKSDWPYVCFTRNPADDGAEYFGPFYNGYALKKALRYLRKVFPYYTREPGKQTSRLDEDLGLSPRRADGPEAYKQNLRKLISYIKGNRIALARELEQEMKQAAKAHDFEKAALLRNRLSAMRELQRRVMFGDREFLDISKDRALADLAELLSLPNVPRRIEGYDISHMGGTNVVASMVVFTNGVSDRAQYRKFKTKIEQNNDVGNMHETLLRRFSEKNIKSWGMPELVLIDGGKAQLDAALAAMSERGVAVPTVSIAKREEEIIIHTTRSHISLDRLAGLEANPISGVGVYREKEYVIVNLHVGKRNAGSHSRNLGAGTTLSPYGDVVKLFQRIRDESHRFAISYHTVLKRKRQTENMLEEIPGIGPATRRRLIKTFGSMRGVSRATEAELVQAVGKQKALQIKKFSTSV